MADQVTMLANLINPQVMADIIETKYIDNIVFAPLARIDSTLVGQPGDTVTLPKFTYIGNADDVAEGADIETKMLTSTSVQVKVKKVGKGASITDEAALSGYGDPVGELSTQLPLAIASKMEDDLTVALNGIAAGMTYGTGTEVLSANVISSAVALFGEDLAGSMVLLISPAQLSSLRKDPDYINGSEIATKLLIDGSIGMIWGAEILVSNRIKNNEGVFVNFIVKPEALALYLKRDTFVEVDRKPKSQITDIYATKMYAAYLYDESKAVKLVTKA